MVFARSISVLLFVVLAGCQRLPEEEMPGSGGGGGDDDDGGTTFIPQDDDDDSGGESGEAPMSCDPVEQSGCNAGERCTAIGSSGGQATFGCVPDDGDLGPYEPCEPLGAGVDGCPAGFACIHDVNNVGACLPLCNSSADCDLGACLSATPGSAPYCADDCSPFDSLCAAPTQCRRNGERFSCRVPQETDVGVAGSSCVQTDDGGCTTGFICVPGALVPDCTEQNCCASLCELDDLGACQNPATCNPALMAPAPGFEGIGACFVPA